MASVQKKDIIAIGGSAGSGAVLRTLIADLPADLPASVFVSTHIPAHSPGFLSEVLSSRSDPRFTGDRWPADRARPRLCRGTGPAPAAGRQHDPAW